MKQIIIPTMGFMIIILSLICIDLSDSLDTEKEWGKTYRNTNEILLQAFCSPEEIHFNEDNNMRCFINEEEHHSYCASC